MIPTVLMQQKGSESLAHFFLAYLLLLYLSQHYISETYISETDYRCLVRLVFLIVPKIF